MGLVCVPYDYLSCFVDSYFIGSVVVVVITFVLNGYMGPQSPVISMNCYSGPYGERNKIFGSIFALLISASPVY